MKFVLADWYSKDSEVDIDLDKKTLKIKIDDFIVCNRNGLGYFMTAGGATGIWAYVLDDKNIEGVQLECQGRGDKYCLVECNTKEEFKKRKIKFFEDGDLNYELEPDYPTINKPRQTVYSKRSLRQLIDANIFTLKNKIIEYKGDRFFPVDISMIYTLEKELSSLKTGEGLLFKAAVESMKKLVYKEDLSQIPDLLSALGWGEILIKKEDEEYKLISAYYPWSAEASKSKFIIFRGMISGMFTKTLKKNIEFHKISTNLIGDTFTLTIAN